MRIDSNNNNCRYQQIAELAHNTDTRKDGSFVAKPKGKEEQEDVFYQIAQELYRVVLFGVFFLQTSLAAFLPIVGTVHSSSVPYTVP